jgi:TRAP-type uncharacterized transport system fused permease subunit
MFYKITADIIVLLHFLWIIFLVFGAFIGRRYKWVKAAHITGIGLALIIQLSGWYCPLTYLEVWLRRMYDPSEGYAGSFIISYVEKIVYIELTRNTILAATIFLVLMSIYIYRPKK